MNILVTGGCGYKGSVLVPKLLSSGHNVTVVDAQWFGNYLASHAHLTVVSADIRTIAGVPMRGVEVIIHLALWPMTPAATSTRSLHGKWGRWQQCSWRMPRCGKGWASSSMLPPGVSTG